MGKYDFIKTGNLLYWHDPDNGLSDGAYRVISAPENMEEYNYYRYKVMPESRIGSTYSGLQLAYVIEEYVEKFNRDMEQRFPGK